MVQTYYGIGKGKTTAAIGGLIRAHGSGKKTLFVQFLKNDKTNECVTLKALNIECIHPNCEYVIFEEITEESLTSRAQKCCEFIEELCGKVKEYDFVVLDEVLDLLEFGYLPISRLIELIKKAPHKCEIVLTGHKLPKEIEDISNYVSFIQEIKHPYNKGVKQRKGIEY